MCTGILSACHAQRSDPAALFQAISADYLHGSIEVAESKAARARQAFSSGGPESDPAWGIKFQLLDAELLLKQNHAAEALSLLPDEPPLGASGDAAIQGHLLRSQALYYLGRAAESDRELRTAHDLAAAANSPLLGEVLSAEALVLLDAGHLDAAREMFVRSLAIARERGDVLLHASALYNIAYVTLQGGRYDEAVNLSKAAVEFARSVQARKQLQWGLGNRGWAYLNLGDFEQALDDFQEAEAQARSIGLAKPRVLWLQDAGLAEYELGHLPEARRFDEQALAAALQLPTGQATDQIVNIETNLALLLHAQGDDMGAKRYSDQAALAAGDSKDANVIAYTTFLQGLVATQFAGEPDAERLLLKAREMTSDAEMRMEIENGLGQLYAKRHKSPQAEEWYRRSIATFEQNRSSVQDETLRLSSFAYGDTVYRDYAEFLIEAHRPLEALALLDRSRARTLEEGLGAAPNESRAGVERGADAAAVARKLGAVLLFYSLGPHHSHLWASDGREVHLFTLPALAQIQSRLEVYQKAIQKSSDPLQMANPEAIALYEMLIQPAAAMIPPGSQIFIVPDSILHSLNFDTLLAPSAVGYHYWIEDVTVTTASSIRMLSRVQDTSRQRTLQDLLLIGDPLASGAEFEPLPNAALEIERIGQHFAGKSQTVVTRASAIPAAYSTSSPEHFRYIHFVAHGTASRLRPLESAVVLSPAPGGAGDFKLYAREVVQHPLNARLVTISACNGSGVRTYAGEGLVGLAWAFLRAGAHNVIAALWQADDAATPLLMDRLYAELEGGKAPAVALRSAKLALIHSTGVYRKPLYWGAFQLYVGS